MKFLTEKVTCTNLTELLLTTEHNDNQNSLVNKVTLPSFCVRLSGGCAEVCYSLSIFISISSSCKSPKPDIKGNKIGETAFVKYVILL